MYVCMYVRMYVCMYVYVHTIYTHRKSTAYYQMIMMTTPAESWGLSKTAWESSRCRDIAETLDTLNWGFIHFYPFHSDFPCRSVHAPGANRKTAHCSARRHRATGNYHVPTDTMHRAHVPVNTCQNYVKLQYRKFHWSCHWVIGFCFWSCHEESLTIHCISPWISSASSVSL